MASKTVLTIELHKTLERKNFTKDVHDIYVFESTVEGNNIYESRAKDLANILAYDKEHYSDVNIETIIRACELADIIIDKTEGEKK
jgi:hypothetical protein